jgi:hypothetical protein
VAASNGPIPPKEFSALRAAFKTLKLEVTVLDEFISHGSTIDEPIRISPEPAPASAPVLALDEERLRQIVSETREVSRRLAEVMDEAEPEDEADASPPHPEPAPTKKTIDPRFTGLDPRYHSAVAEIVTRPEWSRPDFDTLVRSRSLMPSATLDIVNEWAMDTFGDPILEEDEDRLLVHVQLIAK